MLRTERVPCVGEGGVSEWVCRVTKQWDLVTGGTLAQVGWLGADCTNSTTHINHNLQAPPLRPTLL